MAAFFYRNRNYISPPIFLSIRIKNTISLFTTSLYLKLRQLSAIIIKRFYSSFSNAYSWRYAPRTEVENPRFGGLVLMVSPNELFIAGKGLIVTFEANKNDNSLVGKGSDDAGKFVDGKWTTELRLNGDQTHQGRHIDIPVNTFSIQKVKLYKYR